MYAAGLISSDLLHKQLDEHCRLLAHSGYLNGSVLVASEGRILLSKGYGMANFEHDIPNTPQTKYRIGSLTKQFTAMAIIMMDELKQLSVHDPISQYIPGYPNGEQITIHHLLTHTAGIPNFTSFANYGALMRLHSTTKDTISRFSAHPLQFDPGTQFDYSNSGYVILSYLIEQMSGRSYEDYIHHVLLKPLGMMHSGYDNARQMLKNRASGYEIWGDIVHAEFTDMSIPSGAGGMYSTVEDLYLWGLALHAQRQISEQSYERMITPYHGNYGYGLFVQEEERSGISRKIIGHSGSVNGFISEMNHYKYEDLTVIVLSNLSTTPVSEVACQLARMVLGDEVKAPVVQAPVKIAGIRRNALLGSYASESAGEPSFYISLEKEKLYLTQEGCFKYEICPYYEAQDEVFFFLVGLEGKVTYSSVGEEVILILELFGGAKRVNKTG